MTNKLTQGSVIPEFRYDTPYEPQKSFYKLLDDDKPVMLVFLRNFGHPLSRHYIMEYAQTIDQLWDARLVCVVQTRPQVIAGAMPEASLPYPIICDAEGVLYEYFGVEREPNWLKSYSLKALKIIQRAKKQGFEENRKEPQQLPLTAVVAKRGEVLFAHYGQSLTDIPEDCGAMQRVMEGLQAILPPKEDDLDAIMQPLQERMTSVLKELPVVNAVDDDSLFSQSFGSEEDVPLQMPEESQPDFSLNFDEADWDQDLFDELPTSAQQPAAPKALQAPAKRGTVPAGSKTIDLVKLGFVDR